MFKVPNADTSCIYLGSEQSSMWSEHNEHGGVWDMRMLKGWVQIVKLKCLINCTPFR